MALDPNTVALLTNIAVTDGPEVIALVQAAIKLAVSKGQISQADANAIWAKAHSDWNDAEAGWNAAEAPGG